MRGKRLKPWKAEFNGSEFTDSQKVERPPSVTPSPPLSSIPYSLNLPMNHKYNKSSLIICSCLINSHRKELPLLILSQTEIHSLPSHSSFRCVCVCHVNFHFLTSTICVCLCTCMPVVCGSIPNRVFRLFDLTFFLLFFHLPPNI